jgi:hypothetical protein
MTQLSLEQVQRIRARLARAQVLAAARFRAAFEQGAPALAHLAIQAAALLECTEGVRLRGAVDYDAAGDVITPFVERGKPIYGFFDVDRTPEAVFEYWLVVSEIAASTSWRMTRLIASSEEYDEALRRMKSPQIVRALVVSFLPEVDVESGRLEATLHTRAGEERIERRTLILDPSNEFHYHGRELIAEGRGGVAS